MKTLKELTMPKKWVKKWNKQSKKICKILLKKEKKRMKQEFYDISEECREDNNDKDRIIFLQNIRESIEEIENNISYLYERIQEICERIDNIEGDVD